MNNEEKNERKNNSQGIFYAVIGVATLVVTIVGATFAYFSATAGSNENAITTGSTNVTLGFTENTDGLRNDLIPMDEALWTSSNIRTWVGISDQETTKCKDVNDNSICSVYQFTITNSNAAAQTLYPTFTVNTNGFTNLKYAVFKGAASSIQLASGNLSTATGTAVLNPYNSSSATQVADGTLIIPATTVPAAGSSHTSDTTGSATQTLDNMRITLPGTNGSITYTIVLWLHETNQNQSAGSTATSPESDEAGKSFAGTITFSTGDGSGGVTGRLSA